MVVHMIWQPWHGLDQLIIIITFLLLQEVGLFSWKTYISYNLYLHEEDVLMQPEQCKVSSKSFKALNEIFVYFA